MSNLLSFQEVSQDPAVQIILPEATALSVEANWQVIMNNFGKIGGWIMQGEASPNPLPPILKAASDQLNNNSTAIAEMREAYKGIQGAYTQLEQDNQRLKQDNQSLKQEDIALFDHIMDMKKEMTAMAETIKQLQETAAPAKKSRTKKADAPIVEATPEPVTEPVIEAPAVAATPAAVEPDEVDLTAAAVGAGQLDDTALAQLDGLLMAL